MSKTMQIICVVLTTILIYVPFIIAEWDTKREMDDYLSGKRSTPPMP
jgi:hypothetical protein